MRMQLRRTLGIVSYCACALSVSMSAAMAQQDKVPAAPSNMKDAMKQADEAIKQAKEGIKKQEVPGTTPPAASAPSEADMMKAMMEAGQPGENHAWLAKMEGSFDYTVKMYIPGQPPMESKGTSVSKVVFGGRYLYSTYKGDFGGQTFEGVGTIGYNNVAKRFESMWMDNMSTGTMFSTGELDKDKKTLTVVGEEFDPMTKKASKVRETTTWNNDNQFTMVMYKTEGGKESKTMEIVYTRSGAAPTQEGKMNDKMDGKMKAPGMKDIKDATDKIEKVVPTKK